MRINLVSEAEAGDGPGIELFEYFAEHDRVTWDELSPLKPGLATVVKNARKHAEKQAGAAMVLEQVSIERIGPIKGVHYYCYTAYFQREDDEGEPLLVVLDLQGKLVESEVLTFKNEKEYEKHLKKMHKLEK